MKHLKKLSVVLMLTALFSVTFTSCIDNEVSPVVEAIYEAQADLIAAQANLQNAQATYYEAQAAAETSAAANLAAITAANVASTNATTDAFVLSSAQALIAQVAATELAVEQARIAMLLAQAQFDQQLAVIAAAIRTAGSIEAAGYAAKYATAMSQLAALKGQKLTLLQEIAVKELYMKNIAAGNEMTWSVYLAGLQQEVLAKQASVAANQAYIVRANAYLNGDYADMVAALEAAGDAVTAKEAEITALEDEKDQIDADIATGGNYANYISNYNTLVSQLNVLKADLKVKQDAVKTLNETTIPGLQAKITNYAGTTTTLKAARDAAVAVVGQVANTPYTGLLGDILAIETALGDYSTAPAYGDDARTATAPDVLTAQDKLWNADLALLTFEADFAGLTASYNLAANNLVTATNTYNVTDWVAENTTAASAVTTAQGNLTTATAYYDAKKAIFEAAPAGKTWFDLTTPLGTTSVVVEPYTNTKVGIHTDDALYATSYSLVSGWVEVGAGTGNYVPTGLAAPMLVAIPVGGTLYVGTVAQGAGNPAPATAYYVEVEADDVFETNVDLFNAASTTLGVEVTTAFYTGTNPRVYASDIASPTVYQALWNAQKLVSYNLYAQANAAAILADAQEDYDYQKALFETGLATRVTLEAAVTAADDLVSDLEDDLVALNKQLGSDPFTTPVAGNTAKTLTSTTGLGTVYYLVGTVKTFTAYAVKWNATLAYLNHLATPLTGAGSYTEQLATAQAALVTANNYISEYNILIARKTADIAALTAEYEALVATPLYAAQQVRLLEIADEIAVLEAEKDVLEAEEGALSITVMFEGSGSVVAIETAIAAAQAVIDAAPAYIAQRNAAIAVGNVTVANLTAEIVKLKADLVVLDAQIAAKAAEAAGYLALMNAALAS